MFGNSGHPDACGNSNHPGMLGDSGHPDVFRDSCHPDVFGDYSHLHVLGNSKSASSCEMIRLVWTIQQLINSVPAGDAALPALNQHQPQASPRGGTVEWGGHVHPTFAGGRS